VAGAALAALEGGMLALAAADGPAAAALLPRAVHALVSLLAAAQDGVRFGASQVLRNLLLSCLDGASVAAAVAAQAAAGGGRRQMPAATSVVAAVAGALAPRYQDAWQLALPAVGDLLERLGAAGAPLAAPLLLALDQLCAGAFDAGEAPGDGAPGYAAAAEAAMGAALRSLGPDAVLAVLPLRLKEGLDGTAEARTWMLPLLRRHVRYVRLAFWGGALMPLAKALGGRAALAGDRPGERALAQACLTLERQLWAALPSFCSWPRDGGPAFSGLARDLGAAFSNRPDLRPAVCAALQRLCEQNARVLVAAGRLPSYEGGSSGGGNGDGEEEEDYEGGEDGGSGRGGAGDEDAAVHRLQPEGYGLEQAEAALAGLRTYARHWLPLLFKTFLDAPPEQRGPLAAATSAYARIADAELMAGLFRAVLTKLAALGGSGSEAAAGAPTEGGATAAERRCSFMDLALCAAPGMDDGAMLALLKVRPGGGVRPGSGHTRMHAAAAAIAVVPFQSLLM